MSDAEIAEAIERATRERAGLWAPSELDRAARLAADVFRAGEKHGVTADQWRWVTNIPAACVDVLSTRDSIPQTAEGAVACLDAVVDALRERGVPAVRDELTVPVDRTDNTPPLGKDGRALLAVTISIDQGWGLTYSSGGMSRVETVTAPHDAAGAAEVVELAIAVNTGRIPNPFRQR